MIIFSDLNDVIVADEDNNSIPTDDVNRASIGNVAMQVVQIVLGAKLSSFTLRCQIVPPTWAVPNCPRTI